MSALTALRNRFSRQIGKMQTYSGDEDDPSLAELAKIILDESGEAGAASLALCPLLAERKVATPKTLRIIANALLKAWARSHDPKVEKEFVTALLDLKTRGEKEEGQLNEALRHCTKAHLNYQPQKLLAILGDGSDEHNKLVIQWAFQTLALMCRVEHLRFAAQCLQACGDIHNAPQLREAAVFHIESAAKTLQVARDKLHFTEPRGGPWKPMDEQILVRTANQVDCRWITSHMAGDVQKSIAYAQEWLDHAKTEVLKNLGPVEARGFGVDLIVDIYPHEKEWYRRRNELTPLTTVSRSV